MPVTPDHEHRLAPETRVQTLVDWFAKRDGVLVAFSGGVDSSVVAAAAFHALGNRAVACTAISPSVPAWQRDQARQIALEIGIDHREFETREAVLDAYVRNDSRRCFHCKQTLYQAIKVIRDQSNLGGRSWCLVSGTNADDLGDHRPGIQAGRMAGVETPLADLAWNKSHVRAAATALGLSNAMLPASPCLASRIAYGTEVTPRRLQRIEFAEKLLREAGYDIVRVRLRERDSFDLASIEVDACRVAELQADPRLPTWIDALRHAGFASVTIQPGGFRSGRMNDELVTLGKTDE